MHAVVFEHEGGPEVLEYKEVPDPTAGEGHVLVRVEAIGVNYRDVYERRGTAYRSHLPAVIGVEGAGTIVETGERVAWISMPGSYAELVVADRDRLVPVPDGVGAPDGEDTSGVPPTTDEVTNVWTTPGFRLSVRQV